MRIKKKVRKAIRAFGYDLVPSYLCPEGHKLVDFRREAGFSQIADEIKGHRRTRLDYNRLFVLWQAVNNIYRLGHAVAEIGSYKGGSARFIASAFKQIGQCPPPRLLIHLKVTRTLLHLLLMAHTPGGTSAVAVSELCTRDRQ